MAMPPSYKPSPLSYGSPHARSSPFRRPESPVSPSSLRQTTPSASPTKTTPFGTTSRFGNPTTPTTPAARTVTTPGARTPVTPTARTPTTPSAYSRSQAVFENMQPTSPVRTPARPPPPKHAVSNHGNALSQLQPSQVRTIREGFQILDRDSDGTVGREDIADMLTQLGLPSGPSDVSQFFPPSAPQTIQLATFLNSIATALASLSPSSELLSAFSAFDDDDNGQVDLAELRDALLHTAPEAGERPLTEMEVDRVMEGFTGRRAFSKSKSGGLGKRGEVFKYQDFVHSVLGSSNGQSGASSEDSEESG